MALLQLATWHAPHVHAQVAPAATRRNAAGHLPHARRGPWGRCQTDSGITNLKSQGAQIRSHKRAWQYWQLVTCTHEQVQTQGSGLLLAPPQGVHCTALPAQAAAPLCKSMWLSAALKSKWRRLLNLQFTIQCCHSCASCAHAWWPLMRAQTAWRAPSSYMCPMHAGHQGAACARMQPLQPRSGAAPHPQEQHARPPTRLSLPVASTCAPATLSCLLASGAPAVPGACRRSCLAVQTTLFPAQAIATCPSPPIRHQKPCFYVSDTLPPAPKGLLVNDARVIRPALRRWWRPEW